MKLGSILGAVAGIVLMATGVGVLAGAMLLASSLASAGIIGGSIGKFMNSGLGRGLMAAVSLGSAAYAMYGANMAAAGATQGAQTAQVADMAGKGVLATDTSEALASDSQVAAMTNTSFMNAVGTTSETSQMAAQAGAAGTSGVSQASLNAANSTITGPSSELGAASSQASAGATTADTGAVQSGNLAGGSAARGLGGAQAPAGAGEGGGAGMGATAANPNELTGVMPPGADAYKAVPPAGTAEAGASASGPGWGGTLMKALDTKGGSALVQGAGSMLGGIGSGISQKQAMEDEIKAQQWGNLQWQNQSQVARMQAAAARPITVPQGYLQRAQQTRALMQGNQGVQPLPAASPGAPLAPSPVHI